MTNFVKNRIVKEALVSLVIVTVYQVLTRIPAPFVSLAGLSDLSQSFDHVIGRGFFEDFSIVALGIMPYISSCILVEIGSLFLPFLKKYRKGDYYGRVIIRRYALWLTLFLSIVQGMLLVNGLEKMILSSGESVLTLEDNVQRMALIWSMVAPVFLIFFLGACRTQRLNAW